MNEKQSILQNRAYKENNKHTITEFQGIVGRSWLNKSVKPNSSINQLSLSQSMMVLSKSKTITILLDILSLRD